MPSAGFPRHLAWLLVAYAFASLAHTFTMNLTIWLEAAVGSVLAASALRHVARSRRSNLPKAIS